MVIDASSRDYPTFTSPYRSFRWCCLPFGVRNGPNSYSRLVLLALKTLPPGFTSAYIDDIIIYSSTLHEHVKHIEAVLAMPVRFCMKLNMSKCHVAQSLVDSLGHRVSTEEIGMISSYEDGILEWKVQLNAEQLCSFLGFTGYYRSFIKDYGKLTAKLNAHRNDKHKIQWTAQEREDFNKLKEAFRDFPV